MGVASSPVYCAIPFARLRCHLVASALRIRKFTTRQAGADQLFGSYTSRAGPNLSASDGTGQAPIRGNV
jgi:hypothetical protein